MERLLKKWRQYRYRFVPWIALNLKDRSVRSVPKGSADKLASDGDVLNTLTRLLSAFHQHQSSSDKSYQPPLKSSLPGDTSHTMNPQRARHYQNLRVMKGVVGFAVERRVSSIAGGGRGVMVTEGRIPKGTLTSLYPGLIYENYEPILFQSLGNPFIFRCIDSLLIDGNDKGISRFLYRSCQGRDRVGPYALCDDSWLTEFPINPLAVGQYVNNHTKEQPANVAYQEFDVPADFLLHLRQYLPNTYYSTTHIHRLTRLVVLVSTRDIDCGEELLSSYFTVVH